MSDQHFENLREEEAQRERERVVDAAFAERAGTDPIPEDFENEPGHKNRDISELSLLHTNIDEIFEERKNYEPNPEVSDALDAIRDLRVDEAIDEAD